jgi:hypothetical protein
MPRWLTISLFYIVLIAPLCLHVQLPATVDYQLFSETLDRAIQWEQHESEMSFRMLKEQSNGFYSHERATENYHKAQALRNKVKTVLDFLEAGKL